MIHILRNIHAKQSQYAGDLVVIAAMSAVLVAAYLAYLDWCIDTDGCVDRLIQHSEKRSIK